MEAAREIADRGIDAIRPARARSLRLGLDSAITIAIWAGIKRRYAGSPVSCRRKRDIGTIGIDANALGELSTE